MGKLSNVGGLYGLKNKVQKSFDRYHIYPKYMYWDRQARANNVGLDKTPQHILCHLGLHSLPLILQILTVNWAYRNNPIGTLGLCKQCRPRSYAAECGI